MSRKQQRGEVMLEMMLVGILIIFVLIATFEISRGMWMYHTAAHAVRNGVRFAIVHGQNCQYNPPAVTNSCGKTQADIAAIIQNAGIGLDPGTTTVTFCTGLCASNPGTTCTLNACDSTNAWPPNGHNDVGDTIEIDLQTPFISMAGWARANLSAASSDQIQF